MLSTRQMFSRDLHVTFASSSTVDVDISAQADPAGWSVAGAEPRLPVRHRGRVPAGRGGGAAGPGEGGGVAAVRGRGRGDHAPAGAGLPRHAGRPPLHPGRLPGHLTRHLEQRQETLLSRLVTLGINRIDKYVVEHKSAKLL